MPKQPSDPRTASRPVVASQNAGRAAGGVSGRPRKRRTTAPSKYPANVTTKRQRATSWTADDSYHSRGGKGVLAVSCSGGLSAL
jgi:hypothetical protein